MGFNSGFKGLNKANKTKNTKQHMRDTTLTLPRPDVYKYFSIMYPPPCRPSTGRDYTLPSLRGRRQFACSFTTAAHLSDTQTHCSSITTQHHLSCDTELASQACEEMTGPALSPRVEVVTTNKQWVAYHI